MTPEEFFKSVQKTGNCWVWTGYCTPQGYGQKSERIKGRVVNILAHRYSYQLHKGRIPKGLQIRHTCDNPPCVNPDHLLVGTHTDNMRDVGSERWSKIRKRQFANMTPAQREEMSKVRLRMWANMSPEVQQTRAEKIAASKLGKKLSPEHIAKLRAAKLGKPAKISDEAKARKNEKLKAVWSDPEKRATQTPTEQQREANSAKHRELWASGAYANRKPKGTP